jgi:hypothetical protein
MNEIGFRNRSPKESASNDSSSNRKDSSDFDESYSKNTSNITDEVHIVDDENDTHVTKQKVKDALIKNKIDEYVAIKHHEEENKVLILRKDDAEQHGIYHCRHCGMEFDNHIKLGVHLRLHFVVA